MSLEEYFWYRLTQNELVEWSLTRPVHRPDLPDKKSDTNDRKKNKICQIAETLYIYIYIPSNSERIYFGFT